ncbi:hyalin-like [Glandiceps talaboti]
MNRVDMDGQKREQRDCGSGAWTKVAAFQSCYHFTSQLRNRGNGQSMCINNGADLVVIGSSEEQSWISSHMETNSLSNEYWIGITTKDYLWVNGQTDVAYNHYSLTSTPDECIYIDPSDFTWRDGDCSTDRKSLCEKIALDAEFDPPVIRGCPTDIKQATDPTSPTASVTWTEPSATDSQNPPVAMTTTHVSGSTFAIGPTIVTYTFTDAVSNSAMCQFAVKITDLENPVFLNCSSNMTVNTSLSSGKTTVSWQPPVASDNSGHVTLTASHQVGALFTIGLTTVTYTASDPAGNAVQCSFTITVKEFDPPIISGCPTDIKQATDPTSPTASVTWTEPSATDSQNPPVAMTTTHVSGSTFAIGPTIVTYTFTDAVSNSAMCQFAVTITDEEKPIFLNCSSNMTVNTSLSSGNTTVSWQPPVASDNSGHVNLTASHQVGALFTIGLTTVTYTASDPAGNEVQCSFTITVKEFDPPIISGCPTDINQATDPTSPTATVTWTEPSATDSLNPPVAMTTTHVSGSTFAIGPTIVTYTFTDAVSNSAMCQFAVTITDEEKPIFLNCSSNMTVNTSLSSGNTTVSWQPPVASDNSGHVNLTASHQVGALFAIGLTTVTYTASDPAGNEVQCSFTITVKEFDPPIISGCPTDINQATDPTSPTATVTWTEPSATDSLNPPVAMTTTHVSGSTFAIGPTNVTYTFTDAVSNSAMCQFAVTITDEEKPAFLNCSSNMTVNTSLSSGNTTVSWQPPVASDNSGHVTLTASHQVGALFTIGLTTVTYTASDPAGNEVQCSFTITVKEFDPPIISGCPTDINQATDPTSPTATVTWTEPSATDSLNPPVAMTTTHVSGSTFAIGPTNVTYTFTDAVSNSAMCQFAVTITDEEKPAFLNCSSNMTVNTSLSSGNTTVSWQPPVASDNSGHVTLTASHQVGALFTIGLTTVTYTASDPAGNEVQCSFTITVKEFDPPVIRGCPTDINQATDPTSPTATVTWTEPSATDSQNPPVAMTTTHVSGSPFAIGPTNVTYTFTDAVSNAAMCQFAVTITDEENPVFLNCSSNMTVNTSLSSSNTTVSWQPPVASDNSGHVNLTASHQVGALFTIGLTTVTYTASDPAGNEVQCSFIITVKEFDPPVISGCPTDINQATDPTSPTATVTWTEPSATDSQNPPVAMTTTHVSSSTFAIGPTIVTYTFTDAVSNSAMCQFAVTITDEEKPVFLNCSSNMTVNTSLSSGKTTVSWQPPVASDNSGHVNLTASHQVGALFTIGLTTVTYTASDPTGNEVQCSFTITVKEFDPPVISGCPTDINQATDPTSPTATVTWTEPSATDSQNPPVAMTTTQVSGSTFAIGPTNVTYTFTDAVSNSAMCQFAVTITDEEKPVFLNCSSNMTVNTPLSSGNTTVSWQPPVASDNSGHVNLTASHQVGALFTIGLTTVTYTASDPAGNEVQCSFTITVKGTNLRVNRTQTYRTATFSSSPNGHMFGPETEEILISKTVVKGKIQCAHKCLKEPLCQSFNFDNNDRKCALLNHRYELWELSNMVGVEYFRLSEGCP